MLWYAHSAVTMKQRRATSLWLHFTLSKKATSYNDQKVAPQLAAGWLYTCVHQDEAQSAHWQQWQVNIFTVAIWHKGLMMSHILHSSLRQADPLQRHHQIQCSSILCWMICLLESSFNFCVVWWSSISSLEQIHRSSQYYLAKDTECISIEFLLYFLWIEQIVSGVPYLKQNAIHLKALVNIVQVKKIWAACPYMLSDYLLGCRNEPVKI